MIKNMLKNSFFKNSLYLMITSFISLILGFIFWIIASKYYTPEDIGITSAIISSMSLILMISQLGFPTTLIYYLPRDPKNTNKIINSCLTVSVIMSTIFSSIFILGIKIWTPELKILSDNLEMSFIFILTVTLATISGILSSAFMARRRMSFQMIKENSLGITKIIPLIFLSSLGTIGIFLSWGIGLLIAVIVGFILLYKLYTYSPKLTIDPIIKTMAKYSAGNYFAGIFKNLPNYLFPIILLSFISAEYAGYFFIAMTMAGLLNGISLSISNSLLSESFKGDLWENVSKAVKFNLALLIPGIIMFIIFGKFILNIFNPSYAEHATTTLIILAIASIPVSVINIYNTVRNIQKRVESIIKLNAIVAIMTLLLSIPLIQAFGIEGAAIAYFIGNIIGATIVIIRIKSPISFTLNLIKGK